ncbi:MAG TPA: sigma-70 family RNA polymerase sigma factor [Urbifossiella sp.]|jgi:RNA polymerase sigma factor (sigma-70 family)|nr:sigma-70 family RNA polymerase sigma factor [Urbifossiella sp.]
MPRPFFPRLLATAIPAGEAAPDIDLLRRFARDGDAAAFELVVRRHAAAVWAACRRILPAADAEDAFQATFLVLARKPGAVRWESAGGWLYRVAVTAALKRKAAGRRGPTGDAADPPDRHPGPADDLARAELAAVVHEELARLPDRYRLPVVLCDLEGETQPAAAARLGWPVGSVATRLGRARALLRDRLTRRGFAPAGTALVLPFVAAPGRVVTAAVAAATGTVPPPAPVFLLAAGVLSAMRTAKLKLAGVILISAWLVGAAGFGAYTAAAQPEPPPRSAAKADPPPPAAAGPGKAAPPAKAGPEKTMPEKTFTVNFDNAPWGNVLDWYATESGLTLVAGARPIGNLTIKPPAGRRFTLSELTDLLNEAMGVQKLIIVRHPTMFTIWPADERIDPTRVLRIEESEILRRGKTEMVLCNIGPFKGASAKEVMPEVEKMLGPFGSAILLNSTDRIQVVDTAGNIRRILISLPGRATPAAKP